MARRAKHDVNDRAGIYHKAHLSRLMVPEVGATQHLGLRARPPAPGPAGLC